MTLKILIVELVVLIWPSYVAQGQQSKMEGIYCRQSNYYSVFSCTETLEVQQVHRVLRIAGNWYYRILTAC